MTAERLEASVIAIGGTFHHIVRAMYDDEQKTLQVITNTKDVLNYVGVVNLRHGQYLVDGVLRWGINPTVASGEDVAPEVVAEAIADTVAAVAAVADTVAAVADAGEAAEDSGARRGRRNAE